MLNIGMKNFHKCKTLAFLGENELSDWLHHFSKARTEFPKLHSYLVKKYIFAVPRTHKVPLQKSKCLYWEHLEVFTTCNYISLGI